MRVIQVNKLFYPHIGGIEQVVYDLAAGLKPFLDASMVLVSHEGVRTTEEDIDGIRVIRAGTLGTYWSMPVAPTFPFWIRKLSRVTDLFHFHYPFPLGDISYLLSGAQVPAVVTWHSEIVRQRRFLKAYLPLLHAFLQRVEAIIVTSPQLLEHSEVLRPFAHKCRVVPLGIEVHKHALRPDDDPRIKDIRAHAGDSPIVLFVGRLVYYKGIEVLIKAMESVPDARLIVVGTGPLEPACRALAEELGISRRISFHGSISDAELRWLYHACDVFVLPSVEKSEAFGLVQLEAMSCGKPVICTDLPTGVPFVNRHGETGYVVPPRSVGALADALKALVANSSLRREMGHNALNRVRQHFSRDHMVAQVAEVYQSL